jgi:hypothetical protein
LEQFPSSLEPHHLLRAIMILPYRHCCQRWNKLRRGSTRLKL